MGSEENMTQKIEVCSIDKLPPGERTIVEVEGLPHSIGVFNINGEIHALANLCPHHLAPLCEGNVTGEMCSDGVGDFQFTREGEVIECPWHGWKFDIKEGTSVFNPHKLRTRTYEAAVETKSTGKQIDESDKYGTALKGDQPPIDTYDVDIEEEIVVLYV